MAKIELLEHHANGTIPDNFGEIADGQVLLHLIENRFIPYLRRLRYNIPGFGFLYPFLHNPAFNKKPLVESIVKATIARNTENYIVVPDLSPYIPDLYPDPICRACGNLRTYEASHTGFACQQKITYADIRRSIDKTSGCLVNNNRTVPEQQKCDVRERMKHFPVQDCQIKPDKSKSNW